MIVLERKQKLFLSLFEFPVFYNLPLIWSKKKEKKQNKTRMAKPINGTGLTCPKISCDCSRSLAVICSEGRASRLILDFISSRNANIAFRCTTTA